MRGFIKKVRSIRETVGAVVEDDDGYYWCYDLEFYADMNEFEECAKTIFDEIVSISFEEE